MKRFILLAITAILSVFVFSSCKNETVYEPVLEVGESFSLSDDVISGRVIGNEYLDLFSVFTTREDFILFGDSTAEMYLEQGIIPLKEGENHLVVRFQKDGMERELDIKIEYIPIRSFSVEILNSEKTYHIGEKFDKSTIRVLAVTPSGETVIAEQYTLEYEFSELGESDVGIELGNMYKSITVQVTDEYLPTLDGNFSADGVTYAIKEDSAVLISAKEASGFFAVPRAVIYHDTEYPVTELGNGAFARTEITGILIPDSVKKIARGVFTACELLEWIELPETVTEIGQQAFSDCASLREISLPENLTVLEYGTFLGCSSLFSMSLPNTLTEIGEKAFFGCETLKNVEIPSSLRTIGVSAFAGCSALSVITVPNLQTLGDTAFANCKSLSAFAMAESESLGANIFDGTEVTIYTAENSSLAVYAAKENLSFQIVSPNMPYLVTLPQAFAIEDGYPYREVFALILEEKGFSVLSDYETEIKKDACGYLEAILTWNGISYPHTVFVSYTEIVKLDTDTRGVYYECDPATKTAVLVSCPAYVKWSKVYRPEDDGLFIVPTAISRPDGIYNVIEVREDAFEECENITSVFIPKLTID